MVFIGSALGGDVHLRGFVPELGRVNAGLHFEFLQGVDGGQEQVGIEIDVGVGHAVKGEVIELAAHSGDRELLLGTVAPLARAGPAEAVGEVGVDVGAERDQRNEIAAVQRQIDNAPVFNHRTHRGVFSVEQRSANDDLHGFRQRSDFELEVDTGHLLHLQLDAAADLALEARHLRLDAVNARQERGERVIAGVIRRCRAGEIGRRIRDCYRGAHHQGAGRVGHDAGDLSKRLAEAR